MFIAYLWTTPLHMALYFGNLRAAAILLKRKANLKIRDNDGCLPIETITEEMISNHFRDNQFQVTSFQDNAGQ